MTRWWAEFERRHSWGSTIVSAIAGAITGLLPLLLGLAISCGGSSSSGSRGDGSSAIRGGPPAPGIDAGLVDQVDAAAAPARDAQAMPAPDTAATLDSAQTGPICRELRVNGVRVDRCCACRGPSGMDVCCGYLQCASGIVAPGPQMPTAAGPCTHECAGLPCRRVNVGEPLCWGPSTASRDTTNACWCLPAPDTAAELRVLCSTISCDGGPCTHECTGVPCRQ